MGVLKETPVFSLKQNKKKFWSVFFFSFTLFLMFCCHTNARKQQKKDLSKIKKNKISYLMFLVYNNLRYVKRISFK